jgi:hypothetical protein
MRNHSQAAHQLKGITMQRVFAQRVVLFAALTGAGLAGPLALGADNPKAPPPDEPPKIELVVSPAAEPVPALKYRLLPAFGQQTHGNGALDYGEAANRDMPQFDQNRLNSWLDLLPDRLPVKELDAALAAFARALADLEQASRREVCDWQLPIRRDGFNTRLDDFQNLRIPVRVLALKARLQIARGDLDGAVSSMATTFKVSRDCNQGRLLITSLIACALAGMNSDTLQAFVQHPKAPNLYWALTDLPSPLVDCRTAIDGESLAIDYEFPQLALLRTRRLDADEARRLSGELLARWYQDVKAMDASGGKSLEDARKKFASAARSANDKQILLDSGWSKADVAAMAPEQTAWLIVDHHWRVARDELLKWTGVASPQRIAGANRSQKVFKESLPIEGNPLADFELTKFMPAADLFFAAVDRRDRAIALFRAIEALRMYAAAHQSQLPSSLDKIDAVPIPVDPMTGKPFVYHLAEDGSARLETPRLDANNRVHGRHYVIRVRK